MKELYVGIDVHLRQHVVTVIPAAKFRGNKTVWKKTRSIKIGNNRPRNSLRSVYLGTLNKGRRRTPNPWSINQIDTR